MTHGAAQQSTKNGIDPDVIDIDTYRFVPEECLTISDLLGAAQRVAKAYTQTDPGECTKLLEQLKQLAECDFRSDDEHYRALNLIRGVVENAKAPTERVIGAEMDARGVMVRLMQSVWHYAFMYYFRLQRGITAKKQEE